MNKIKQTIIVLASFVLLAPSVASAVVFTPTADLTIEFENSPLFGQTNMAPGDSVTRFIKVTNNSAVTKTVIAEAINKTDPDNFSSQLKLKIMEGATTVFDNTLKTFFDQGETTLTTVNAGAEKQYDFTVTFDTTSGNDYQDKNLGFDFLVGFQGAGGGGGGGGGTPGESSGGGGTGGGGAPLPGLSILEESIVVTAVGETTATVEWTTNYFSTSQIIYAVQGASFTFDLNTTNFGYPNASPEQDNSPKVTHHTVNLTGLSPSTTYVIRAVSHASPPSISTQKSFTTLNNQPTDNNPSTTPSGQVAGTSTTVPAAFSTGNQNNSGGTPGKSNQQGEGQVLGAETQKTTENSPEFNGGNTTQENSEKTPWYKQYYWLWLLIILILLILLLLKRRKDKEKK